MIFCVGEINSLTHPPTSQLVRDDVSVLENDFSTVFKELKNKSLVFLTGDWNGKVEKKIKQPTTDNCIGRFTCDVRNNSGQHLVNFCAVSNLFVSNTAFQHKTAHINKWENMRAHPKDLTKTIYYKQTIYYIHYKQQFIINSTDLRKFHRKRNIK